MVYLALGSSGGYEISNSIIHIYKEMPGLFRHNWVYSHYLRFSPSYAYTPTQPNIKKAHIYTEHEMGSIKRCYDAVTMSRALHCWLPVMSHTCRGRATLWLIDKNALMNSHVHHPQSPVESNCRGGGHEEKWGEGEGGGETLRRTKGSKLHFVLEPPTAY